MDISAPLIDHGPVDTSAIRHALFDEGLLAVTEYDRKIRRAIAGGRPGAALYLQTYTPANFFNIGAEFINRLAQSLPVPSLLAREHERLRNVINKSLAPVLASFYPDASVLAMQLAELPAGQNIPPHTDMGPLTKVHRLHIPLVTHPEIYFAFEKYKQHLPPDHLFELNNVITHAVYNFSNVDRWHLMIDLLPHETAMIIPVDSPKAYEDILNREENMD